MFRRCLIALLFVVAALPSFGQATFDAQTAAPPDVLTSAANTTTFNHTTTTADNRILLVAVHMNLRNATGTTVTSITYGGLPLTLLDAITDGAPDTRTEVWYRLNPSAGTNAVLMTAGGITPGQNVESLSSATTYSGANQVAPLSATNIGQNTPATVTVAGTTTTDSVLSFLSARETVTLTPAAPAVVGYNVSTGGTNDDVQASVSSRAGAAGSTPFSWTVSANRRWSIVGVAIQQATADVEVTQSALNDPVIPGSTLTYTFHVQNNGPSTATGVTLTDTLPGTVTFISSNTTLGSCSGTTTVTCTLGTMALGATATVTIQVTAPLTGGTIATNTGTVTTTTFDPVTPNTASATSYSLVQATVCGTQPGKDGAGGTLAGIDNSYWPGTANAAVGATSITVGARRGAAVSITAGDLILIIQMQDAAIDSNNDDRYGNGLGITGGTTGIGAGYTNANNVGRYEYAIATNTIAGAGGNLTFTAVGGGNGLVYAYTNANAAGALGQRRFQVVRVPQYTTATLGATLTASTWNGTTGGILAFDVAGDLALGSTTVNVNGLGFRGAGPRQLAGGGAATDVDYRNTAAQNTHGIKAEGIAGTPEWVLDGGAALDVGPQGYPNGDYARGAPGNAGGGGTDTDPAANQENSGGGGGANWGRGGTGGNAWQSNLPTGAFGGAPFYNSPGRVVLGGGGGGGARNNSSGIASSGGAGGGIVLIRAGRLTGTGTVTANGAAAFNDTANDGGGGGGAGGSVVILSRGGGLGGLTITATGGRGGDAWRTQAPGGFPGERHGPGGGGGGGYIALNGTAASTSVTGGASGITTTANDTFGAQPGAPGTVLTAAQFDEITGVKSGCTDLSVAISDSPDPVIAGNNITYTMSVTNNSTVVPAQNPTITLTTAPGTTFVSITPPVGWTCPTTPTPGGTGSIICTSTNPLAPSTTTPNFTMVLATAPSLADGSTVTQSVTTSTSSPEPNTANNTASTNTAVIRRVDVAVTKVTTDPGPDGGFMQGESFSWVIAVTNNGPSRATNVVMTDPLPAGFSFTGVVPGGPTCNQSVGTVTCTYAVMDPGATNNITITGSATVSGTLLTNTATTTRTETDTNSVNDSATATASILFPTVAHMFDMEARQDFRGHVELRWTTLFEAHSLGFNIYRQSGSERVKINPNLIAGSALFVNGGDLRSGQGYRWADRIGRNEFAQYFIEDVDLNGTRTMHGPVTPTIDSAAGFNVQSNSATYADSTPGGGIFVSPRGLGAAIVPAISPTTKLIGKQWEIAGQAAVKLLVTEEGWYRVSRSSLADVGFDKYTSQLTLYAEGNEQSLLVTSDAIEFYGVGLDTAATGARTYWLVGGKGGGTPLRSERPTATKAPATRTPFTFQRIERTVFFAALTNNGDAENFFGAVVTTAGVTRDLTVENLDRSGSAASLEIVLQSASAASHNVRLTFNGNSASTVTLGPKARRVSKVAIPLSWIAEGPNALTVTSLGGGGDISVIESLRITYPHRLVADDNALKLVIAGGSAATVSGFTSSSVRAFDITNPAAPIEVQTTLTKGSASLVAPQGTTRTILVLGDSRVLTPAQIIPNQASSWNDKKNSADMVIITTNALAPAAVALEMRRDSEGIATTIIDVDDVYDEFHFGVRGPQGVREFLQRTRDWKRAPKYVLLLGDASVDPRNYFGFGSFDFVPTKLVPTAFLKTSSDDWLVDFDNDGVPQLAIGRLPARTLDEATTMIRRIAERGSASTNRVTFVTHADPDFDFAGAATTLATLVPPTLTSTFSHTVEAQTFDALLTTYIGHGSTGMWSAGSFSTAAASQLTNARLPFVVNLTCLTGYFHDVFVSSITEALLANPNGGAVGVWASSTLTEPNTQLEMTRELFRQLFAGETIGEAAARSKSATKDQDVRRSWILFGDPSMKLK